MAFTVEIDKMQIASELLKKIDNDDFDGYWTGFQKLPIAIYDDDEVYLINYGIPLIGFKTDGNISVGRRTKDFIGNTAVKFHGQYIGIWDLNTLDKTIDIGELYSGLVHEMFHGYQYSMQNWKLSNEMLYIGYPISPVNIGLRLKERALLLKAVYEDDSEGRRKLISDFVNMREHRRCIVGDRILYEYGVESVEGTATYVEYKALMREKQLPAKFLAGRYGEKLIGENDLRQFRASCYYSGLYQALLLDLIDPCWHKSFTSSGLHLYEFLREHIDWVKKDIVSSPDDPYVSRIIENFRAYKEKEIEKFFKSEGYQVTLEGNHQVTGFDPMNLVDTGSTLLHKHFIGLNNEMLINKPVLTVYENGNVFNPVEMTFFVETKPVVCDGLVHLKGIGAFQGELLEEKGKYVVKG